jgi:hypothetical protein
MGTAKDDVAICQALASARDHDGLVAHCTALQRRLAATAEPYPDLTALKLLGLLRRRRCFGAMEALADALLQAGGKHPGLRRQYAQALIDQGRYTAAQQVLAALADATHGHHPGEWAEAQGLLGRVHKQLYVNGTARADRAAAWLQQALAGYLGPYRAAPQRHPWHGINAVALLARAARDGTDPGPLQPGEAVGPLAEGILGRLEEADADGGLAVWDLATAMEACVALDRPEAALAWARRYTDDPRADAFEMASTLRQMTEVWQLAGPGPVHPTLQALVQLLRAALMQRDGGELRAPATELQADLRGLQTTDLQRVFGTDRYVTLDWYRRGLERCTAVARIGRDPSRGDGTGFLVEGRELCPDWGDEPVLVTNAHVISPTPEVAIALRPQEVVVTFEAAEGAAGQHRRVAEMLFHSRIGELDTTVVRLNRPVPGARPVPVAEVPPRADGRLYAVGHPLGGGLSFSLQDNLLIDIDETRVQYRTPTERGSSGSPVFDDRWELVALHHAGSPVLPRLGGKPGRLAANQGIRIDAIRAAIARRA